jgi:hypothetical protein
MDTKETIGNTLIPAPADDSGLTNYVWYMRRITF